MKVRENREEEHLKLGALLVNTVARRANEGGRKTGKLHGANKLSPV
jgi:hypothetical protein